MDTAILAVSPPCPMRAATCTESYALSQQHPRSTHPRQTSIPSSSSSSSFAAGTSLRLSSARTSSDRSSHQRRRHSARLLCKCHKSEDEEDNAVPLNRRLLNALGVPVWDLISKAQKRLQKYLNNGGSSSAATAAAAENPHRPPAKEKVMDNPELEWTWEDWTEYFGQVEERDSLTSTLKFQLDDAVENEDFKVAASLKGAIDSASENDLVMKVMAELKKALEEERYEEAAKIRDGAGAGLVGWWVGLSGDEGDPFGRIIHISSSQGRYIARAYTARQLLTAAPGIPIFEVFLKKKGEAYQQQAVYLQRESISVGRSSAGDSDDDNVAKRFGDEGWTTQVMETSIDDESDAEVGFGEEGLSQILNFLKDRIPDVKLKVFRVTSSNSEEDISEIVEKLVKETASWKDEEDIANEDDALQEEGTETESDDEDSLSVAVGGVLQSDMDDRGVRIPVRVPAKIEYKSRDSFVFHIEDAGMRQSMPLKEMSTPLRITAILSQTSADDLGSDVEKVTVKVSKELGEFLKLAVSQVQKRRGLYKSTQFQRLKVSEANADAICGLYVGDFGPFTSELIQLRRKHGNWHDSDDASSDSGKLDFFEYVEAVKLTGDLNVPAGQVTFRARIGKGNKLPHQGIYPEELGVTARYKAQGRLAEPGYKNPQWIDGELLLLDGKGAGQLNGAEMGFIYSVPEHHYLVLFHRLKPQNMTSPLWF